MFASKHRADAPVGISDWDDPTALHARHRRHLAGLLIGLAVMAVLAIVIHPDVMGFGLFLIVPIVFEFWMVRRTRDRTGIPDHRPPDPVEIELDDR